MSRLLGVLLAGAIRAGELAGIEATLRFGRGFGRAWCAIRGPRHARVGRQLAHAMPELAPEAHRRIRRDVFAHLGQGLAELLLMSGRHREALLDRTEVIGLEHLEAASAGAGGRGVIVIGAHLGNWELAVAKLTALGVPIALVHRAERRTVLERALVRVRSGDPSKPAPEPAELIPLGERAGIRFVRALAAGRHVLLMLDQRARSGDGVVVDFFGQPASTRFGPVKLAARTGAPVVLAFPRRLADGRRHTVTFHPALQLEPGTSDDEEVLRRNVQRITAEIEKEIRATPGQWIWTHRRWRVPATDATSG